MSGWWYTRVRWTDEWHCEWDARHESLELAWPSSLLCKWVYGSRAEAIESHWMSSQRCHSQALSLSRVLTQELTANTNTSNNVPWDRNTLQDLLSAAVGNWRATASRAKVEAEVSKGVTKAATTLKKISKTFDGGPEPFRVRKTKTIFAWTGLHTDSSPELK